ncbi:MAG TPA: MFS transporter [Actinomycetota bacterium]|nr:MFS transporter [Actinomycetota bacterium]
MSEEVSVKADVPDPAVSVSDPNRFRALFVIAIAQLMIVLDASIVNLAIPSAQADLGIAPQDVQWVVTAYTLAFGGFLLLGGRIADFVGRKKAFLIGLLGFAAASALGGVAMNAQLLFGARALQGVFAALLAPAALALITVTFHDPKERAKAFGVFGAISGGGAAIGLLLGGVLTEYFSWRWCLAVNTPIAILAALLAVRFVRESKAHGDTSYDIPGAVTVTGGLLALVYGFTKAAPAGYEDSAHWTDASTLVWFALAAVLLIAFFVIESRSAHPLLPLRVIRNSNRAGAYISSLMVGAGMFAMFLFLGIFLQTILGYSPVRAGFAFLPFSVGIILGAGVAANLLPKVGPRPLMIPGLIAGGVGMLLLAQLQADSGYLSHVLPAMVIMSLGMAFVFIPTASVALHAIDQHDAGVASAMINTSQQVGGSLGTALMNTVAVTATSSFLVANAAAGPAVMPEALTHGFTRGFYVGAALLFAAAVVVFFMIRIGADAVKEDDEAPVHIG